MTIRPFQPEDEPLLREIYAASHEAQKRQFPFPEDLQGCLVVLDDAGCPIMAAGYRLLPEMTLLCPAGGSVHPLVKLMALELLHEGLRDTLLANGYTEAIASVPPELQGSYGRHLQRHLHWQESWPTYRIRDWKGSR